MSKINNTPPHDDKIEHLSKLNKAIIVSLDQAKKLSAMLVEDSLPSMKKAMGVVDDSKHQNNDEKVKRIRELNKKAVNLLNQAKSLSLTIVDGDCGFTSLDAATQHDYLCSLDEKITQARGLQQGIKMLCG